MSDDLSSRDCIAIFLMVAAVVITALLIVLKLCLVVLFSWWWVFSPIGAAIVILVIWIFETIKSYGK